MNSELDASDIERTSIGSSVASVNTFQYSMNGAFVTPVANQVTPNSPATGDKTTPGGKTTWGDWLKTLVPESAKTVAVNRPAEVKESEQKTFSIPGGFYEIPLVVEVKPIVDEKPVVRKRSGYINPRLAMKVYTNLPPKSPFWPFDDSIFTSGKYRARPPFRDARSDAGGYKRVRRALLQSALTEEEKNRIAEERLVELELIAEDRKVKMREDAFEKRLLLAQLARSSNNYEDNVDAQESQTDDDSAMEDADNPAKDKPTKDRGKAKEKASTEETPTSHETARPVSKPSSFLFGGSAYDPSCAPPRPILLKPHDPRPILLKPHDPRRGLPAPEAKKKKTVSFAVGTKPPAPPTQAKHPNPIAPIGTANLPPPTQRPQLSSQKGISGLGSSDPALKAGSHAEKCKPHVSSGLRSSTTLWSNSRPCTKATNGTSSKASNIAPPSAQISARGPVRNVQKKRSGYGLYYSSDDEDEEMTESKPLPQEPLPPPISTPGPVMNVQTKVKEPKKRSGYGFYYSDYSDDEDEEMPEPKPAPQKPSSPPIATPGAVMNVQTMVEEPKKRCGFYYSDDSNEDEKIPKLKPAPQIPSPPQNSTPEPVMNVQTKAQEQKKRCGFYYSDDTNEDEKIPEPTPAPQIPPPPPPQILTPEPGINVQSKGKEPKKGCGFYYSDDSNEDEKNPEPKPAPQIPPPPQILTPEPVMNVQTKVKEPKKRGGFYYSDSDEDEKIPEPKPSPQIPSPPRQSR